MVATSLAPPPAISIVSPLLKPSSDFTNNAVVPALIELDNAVCAFTGGVGAAVGDAVGLDVGDAVGVAVGAAVGDAVGLAVGDAVGVTLIIQGSCVFCVPVP